LLIGNSVAAVELALVNAPNRQYPCTPTMKDFCIQWWIRIIVWSVELVKKYALVFLQPTILMQNPNLL
jgi:hypothetical protein